MPASIIIRPFRGVSVTELLSLNSTYYSQRSPVRQLDYLEWLYTKNPNGEAELVLSVDEDGSYIGMMALVPFSILCGQTEISARAVFHVLVHARHRTKNLFARMIRAARAHCRNAGAWLIGHPNKNATPGWRVTRMKFRGGYETRVAPPLIGGASCISDDATLTLLSAKSLCDCELDPLVCWQRGLNSPILKADAAFIKWRFLDHPVHRYHVYGWLTEKKLVAYYVRRRYRPGVWLAADWQGHGIWRNGPPAALSGVTIVPWPMIPSPPYEKIPRLLFQSRWARREFPFFSTPPHEDTGDNSWSFVTLSASDIA